MPYFLLRTAWGVQSILVDVCSLKAQLHGTLSKNSLILNFMESRLFRVVLISCFPYSRRIFQIWHHQLEELPKSFLLYSSNQEFYYYFPSVSASLVSLADRALPPYSWD